MADFQQIIKTFNGKELVEDDEELDEVVFSDEIIPDDDLILIPEIKEEIISKEDSSEIETEEPEEETNIVYSGTRFNRTPSCPRGQCVVYDADGNELICRKNKWKVSSFEWGANFLQGWYLPIAEIFVAKYLLARTICEREVGHKLYPEYWMPFIKKINNFEFDNWQITKEELDEYFSQFVE
jgi:hypothetical protein